jgi:hypothetical protein
MDIVEFWVALKIAFKEAADFGFPKILKPLYQWFQKCTLNEQQCYEGNWILDVIDIAD